MKLKYKVWRAKCSTILIVAIMTGFVFAPLSVISAPLSVPPIESFDGGHELEDIIVDNDWAIVLGRAFFWDQQMGSDGGSCASCHYAAGADIRITAQVNPGFTTVDPEVGTDTFGCTEGEECTEAGLTRSGGTMSPEYTLKPEDFPFRKLGSLIPGPGGVFIENKNDVVFNTNDVVSSSGSFDAEFKKSVPGHERCGEANADIFYKTKKHKYSKYKKHGHSKLAARMVEPRNTPTIINAALNFRNFWDGRAENIFSGVGVHGMADVTSEGTENNRLIVMNGGYPELTHLTLTNSSAASQAVGPILSNLEMSCDGRTFQDVARKIYSMRPLAKQRIALNDSTFAIGPKGDLRAKKRGLKGKYRYYKLIQKAFDKKWWKARGTWKIEGGELKKARGYRNGFTQMEMNFPMFWGLAIQAYEQTLISDQSRFDTAEAQGCFVPNFIPQPQAAPNIEYPNVQACIDRGVWTEEEELGRTMFHNAIFGPQQTFKGEVVKATNCSVCHGTNAFTDAAILEEDGSFVSIVDRAGITSDAGFHNSATRPLFQDLQLGGEDGYGNPLSIARQLYNAENGGDPVVSPQIDICSIPIVGTTGTSLYCDESVPGSGVFDVRNDTPLARLGIDGSSKTSTIRNVALTPPYFSYGGYSTLDQVMDFYNRGGSNESLPKGCVTDPNVDCTGDTTGSGPDGNTPIGDLLADPHNNRGSNAGLVIPLFLTDAESSAVVAFMKSLTDERVRCDAGPFDHPELVIFNGHRGKDRNYDGLADDKKRRLPAVGVDGYSEASGLCLPNDGDLFAPGMGNRLGENR